MDNYLPNLQELLDGPFRELRQDNHIDPDRILVYYQENESIKALTFDEIALEHPYGAFPCRWSKGNFSKLRMMKRILYEMSIKAHHQTDEDSNAMPTVGTMVLVIPLGPIPYRTHKITSLILPEEYQ